MGAGEDVRIVSEEEVDRLNSGLGTHGGRDASLVAKLEVMKAHPVTIEADGDPVKLF